MAGNGHSRGFCVSVLLHSGFPLSALQGRLGGKEMKGIVMYDGCKKMFEFEKDFVRFGLRAVTVKVETFGVQKIYTFG